MARPNVREQLVEAGLRTLYRQGFHACTIQDITDAAKVPKGSFYNHFQSKEALALASLDRFWEYGNERRAVLQDASKAPVERLRLHFQMLSEAIIRTRFAIGCLIGNFSLELADNDVLRTRLSDLYAEWTRQVSACVEEALPSGRGISGLPAASIASFLINSWEGAVMRAKVERNQAPLDHFQQAVFEGLFA